MSCDVWFVSELGVWFICVVVIDVALLFCFVRQFLYNYLEGCSFR